MRIVMPVVKMGCAGGAIYLASEQGLFSHSQQETIEAGKKIQSSLSGLNTYQVIPKGVTEYLHSDTDVVGYWNRGVKASTSALASFPSDAAGLIACGVHHLRKEVHKQLNPTQDK